MEKNSSGKLFKILANQPERPHSDSRRSLVSIGETEMLWFSGRLNEPTSEQKCPSEETPNSIDGVVSPSMKFSHTSVFMHERFNA
jgi:hypothetical protein